jgi:hypothetical protein
MFRLAWSIEEEIHMYTYSSSNIVSQRVFHQSIVDVAREVVIQKRSAFKARVQRSKASLEVGEAAGCMQVGSGVGWFEREV